MFKLDDNFLRELGLGSLPVHEKNQMLAHIYETLEMRVGMKLAEQMSDSQLKEFEGFIDRNDEGGALKWLESNFPNYKQVVADELERLKGEIKASAAQIVAASQQFPTAPPQPQQYPAGAYPPQQPGQPGMPPQQAYPPQQPVVGQPTYGPNQAPPMPPQQPGQPQYGQPPAMPQTPPQGFGQPQPQVPPTQTPQMPPAQPQQPPANPPAGQQDDQGTPPVQSAT